MQSSEKISSSENRSKNRQLNPIIRVVITVLASVGVLFTRNLIIAGLFLFCVLLPLLVVNHIFKRYTKLVAALFVMVVLPLFLVWGVLVGAPPSHPIHSAPLAGLNYAAITSIRLLSLVAIFQLCFLTLAPEELALLLKKWGLKEELVISIMGGLSVWSEIKIRAEQILNSRYARGLIPNRSIITRLKQIPYLLLPLLSWTLRASVQRTETWERTGLVENFLSILNGSKVRQQPKQIVNPSRHKGVIAVLGGNFSGRSFLLKNLRLIIKEFIDSKETVFTNLYLYPEIYNCLSGLASSVRNELILHGLEEGTDGYAEKLIDEFSLRDLLDQSPFTLSGGEQALLIFLSSLLLRPNSLAIDCAFEQVDRRFKEKALIFLSTPEANSTAVYLADNRLTEYGTFEKTIFPDHFSLKEKCEPQFSFRSILMNIYGKDVLTSSVPTCDIEIKGLKFFYQKGRDVLQGINLNLEPGKIYFLSGKNGSGKSTFSKILSGILRPQGGQILSNNKEVRPWKMPGSVVAYHFQNPDVQLYNKTVESEIMDGVNNHSDTAEALLKNLLNIFGLEGLKKEHPMDLPFTLRKRVALASTFAMRRPWMILDEPTLCQDDNNTVEIGRTIDYLVSKGTGVIVISHSVLFRKLLSPIDLKIEDGKIEVQKVSG